MPNTNSSQEDSTMTKSLPHINSKTTVGSTKWLALQTLDYTDQLGKPRKWDMASRTTKQPNKGVADAVVIVTLLTSSKQVTPSTLVVEQYRPPVGQTTVEFPAGLIDDGETAVEAALRELKEETGYVGEKATVISSPELCMSPGLCDETVTIVVVTVDLEKEENQKPKQCLEDGEFVQVKRVPLDLTLMELMTSPGGKMPIALLYSFILGMELGLKHVKK